MRPRVVRADLEEHLRAAPLARGFSAAASECETAVARKPCFTTVLVVSFTPGKPSESIAERMIAASTPASINAPSVMSPLIPVEQSR